MNDQNQMKTVHYYRLLSTAIQKVMQTEIGKKHTLKELVSKTAAELLVKIQDENDFVKNAENKACLENAMHKLYTDLCRLAGEVSEEEKTIIPKIDE